VLAVPCTIFFLLGCCFTTPHVLIGLAARELTPPHAASSAGGFVAAMSKLGSASAGAPVGRLMDEHGTDGALALLAATSLMGGAATLTLWNARTYEDEMSRDDKVE
jgi:sugar phosphate permease